MTQKPQDELIQFYPNKGESHTDDRRCNPRGAAMALSPADLQEADCISLQFHGAE